MAPTLSGTAEVGSTLTAAHGTWTGLTPITYSYQWQDCNSAGKECDLIGGATSSTYTVANGDVDKKMDVLVTAANSAGSSSAASAASAEVPGVAPANTIVPAISGTVQQGHTLSSTTGSWTGHPTPTYSYEWERCNSSGEACVPLLGANAATYLLGPGDIGSKLRVLVTASNVVSSVSARSSATSTVESSGVSAPTNTSLPSISGTRQDGRVLSAAAGSWSGGEPIAYAYQWERCNTAGGACEDIDGAGESAYTLTPDDEESTLRTRVTATDGGGSTQATSSATAAIEVGAPSEIEGPTIIGSPTIGQPTVAEGGLFAGSSAQVTSQWERCNASGGECESIAGATDGEYTPAEADEGHTLRLRVGASNEAGSVTALSSPSVPVAYPALLSSTFPPTVTGEAEKGHALTAHAGSWLSREVFGFDSEAPSFTYQWQSCNVYGAECENVGGATSSTYTAGAGVVGHTVRVLVTAAISASEEEGPANQVAEPSAATEAIAAENAPVPSTAPVIQGTGLEGAVLTSTLPSWSGSPTSEGLQWERCSENGEGCSAISGATSHNYTLVEADIGKAVRLLTSAENVHGTTEVLSQPIIASGHKPAAAAGSSISGSDQLGRPLTTEPGIWTGEGAITFSYEWKRCNEAGESCSTIGGATEPQYTPTESDTGHTLKAVVTASNTSGSASTTSPPTPIIGSEATLPANTQGPAVEGNLSEGSTLTANHGTWQGSATITYAYQWQRCNSTGESCSNIGGATGETHTLEAGDVSHTLRIAVEASNEAGTESATSGPSGLVYASGAPTNTEAPSISGTLQENQPLFSSDGGWSGSRPLTYYYQWQRCNTSGESCANISGATKPSYTATSTDVGKTLRARVTTKNTHGEAGSISAATNVIASATPAEANSALESIKAHEPSVIAPSTTAEIEHEPLTPSTLDSGEQLTTQGSLASSTESKVTPGEFAIETSAGEVSFLPLATSMTAATAPTIVNAVAALNAETWHATDTVLRPTALGVDTILELRSSEASSTMSWEVGLDPGDHLEALSDGSVAIVEPLPETSLEAEPGEAFSAPGAASHEASSGGTGYNAGAGEEERETSILEEGGLTPLPAASTATTGEIAAEEGELRPQNTNAIYERDKAKMEYAESHAASSTLAVIEPPTVLDSTGASVTAALTVSGDRITLTITPTGGTKYPVSAELATAAPTNQVSLARDPVLYGLSDPKKEVFEPLDPKLTKAPLHLNIARDVVPYTATASQLKEWLVAVGKNHLTPYITLEIPRADYCLTGHTCKQPEVTTYRSAVESLVKGVYELHEHEPTVVPLVTRWGALNEPNYRVTPAPGVVEENPLGDDPGRAALFWKVMQATVSSTCSACKVAAGEFFQYEGRYDREYLSRYAKTLLTNKSFWPGKPSVWGLHDYKDVLYAFLHHEGAPGLEHFRNPDLRQLLHDVSGALGKPSIWLSEQGVEIQSGHVNTALDGKNLSANSKRQREAANDFLDLSVGHARIALVDYYLYAGPPAVEQLKRPHAFDSALAPGIGVSERQSPREVYCVIVEGRRKGCPARGKTTGHSAMTSSSATVAAEVEPVGLPTTFSFEYGTTTSYGHTTSATSVPEESGDQTVTMGLTGLEACKTYHYQAMVENEANEGIPSLGGDGTFETGGCTATSITAGFESACAVTSDATLRCWGLNPEANGVTEENVKPEAVPTSVPGVTNATSASIGGNGFQDRCARLSNGHVLCWGTLNSEGELGDGSTEPSLTPVRVSGIDDAASVAVGVESACALLESGYVECWGQGALGDGSTESSLTPVTVSGITNATELSAADGMYCALLSTKHIECWGWNALGQLGDGHEPEEQREAATPVTVSGISTAIEVAAARNGSICALVSGGSVYCWGDNRRGALGTGSTLGPSWCNGPLWESKKQCADVPQKVSSLSNAVELAGGGEQMECARLSTGGVDCWGWSEWWETPLFTPEYEDTPTSIPGISEATQLAVGDESACVILTGGKVECWGGNGYGQLGQGTYSLAEPAEPVVGF